jgi:hypothetical protein
MVGFWRDLKIRKGVDVIGPNQVFPGEESTFTWHKEMKLNKEFSGMFFCFICRIYIFFSFIFVYV